LNYIVNQLAENGVKIAVRPALLIGAYCILHMKTPTAVVISETDELLTSIGKDALSGFFHAVLSKISAGKFSLPSKSSKDFLEVKYNMPSFLIGLFKKDYPESYDAILTAPAFERTHIRLGANAAKEDVWGADMNATETQTGFFVQNNKEIALLNTMGKLTYMSLTSTLIVESLGDVRNKRVLDACAAPGGKSVYLSQKGAIVTACDVHEHRVDLIKSYAERMRVPLDIRLADAREFKEEFFEAFDIVLVDAPCSGLGVIGKRRDIVLNRTYQDILDLASLQRAILDNVKRYVKRGGTLAYSTCTVLKKENGENIGAFLRDNADFTLKLEKQFLPDGKGTEGFYICLMTRS